MERIHFQHKKLTVWASMDDYLLVSPDLSHEIELLYEGEPPHGDSYHKVKIDNRKFPGLAWGCNFAMSAGSRFAAFSWMAKLYNRSTVVVDMKTYHFIVLPEYIYDLEIRWPQVIGRGQDSEKSYTVTESEQWQAF